VNDIFLTYQVSAAGNANAIRVVEFLSVNLVKIYNQVNYEILNTGNLDPKYYYKKHDNNWRSKYMTEGMLQQTVNIAIGNWRNYQRALKCYEKQEHTYHGLGRLQNAQPRPPGYKHDPHGIDIVFVRTDFRCASDQKLLIHLPPATCQLLEIDLLSISFQEIWGYRYTERMQAIEKTCRQLKQVRFKWNRYRQCWMLVLVYDVAPRNLPPTHKNVMAIDLGLNNLCAITFRYGTKAFLINGRPLKSFNRQANLRINQAQSVAMKHLQSSKNYSEPPGIKIIRLRRENYIHNYLHQAANLCIKLALAEKCRVIVTGDIKGIKYGKKNRSFVQIPLLRLVSLIKYKAQMHGLVFIEINEAYTSQTSAIDLENIQYTVNGRKRRIHRGAFITNTGMMINSDINGSLNILRLFLNQVYARRYEAIREGRHADLSGSSPELISFIRDKGFVVSPVKLQVFSANRFTCE
jgi:putative transposase